MKDAAYALEKLIAERPGVVVDVVRALDFDGWLVRAQRLRGAIAKRAIGTAPLTRREIEGKTRDQIVALLDWLADEAVAGAFKPPARARSRRGAIGTP